MASENYSEEDKFYDPDIENSYLKFKNSNKYKYEVMTGEDLYIKWKKEEIIKWKENREVDEDRVKSIKESVESIPKNEEENPNFGPNPIHLAKFDDKLYLIDGQHRMNVLKKIAARIRDKMQIFVCTTICESSQEISELFEIVNKGVPVPKTYTDLYIKDVARNFINMIELNFPKQSSKSRKPNRPNYNKENMLEIMGNDNEFSNLIKNDTLTCDILYEELIKRNKEYKPKVGKKGISQLMIDTCGKDGLKLTLEKKWLDEFINEMNNEYNKDDN